MYAYTLSLEHVLNIYTIYIQGIRKNEEQQKGEAPPAAAHTEKDTAKHASVKLFHLRIQNAQLNQQKQQQHQQKEHRQLGESLHRLI